MRSTVKVIAVDQSMNNPHQTRASLSDITNTQTSEPAGAIDDAERKKQERNAQQRKRRAELSSEQREEINRKQCEYRARASLGDITNTQTSDQAGAVDDAEHRKQERNTQQRKRRAEQREEINRKQREYRTEQREEINMKQREYRARKKAESNHTIPTTIVTPTVPSTSLTGSTIVETTNIKGKENVDPDDFCPQVRK
ncbi:hypothetical protein PVAP13_1KG078231 [Panicum virgatum]|uniref:Uncharacterized protein n=1 Tax=Panicum virgatum TaxID=38727 RepID=A0A8T0X8E7_PANVG|nr:hypothetical protein PVAP13_1KG078231 [Panicum virgatum]